MYIVRNIPISRTYTVPVNFIAQSVHPTEHLYRMTCKFLGCTSVTFPNKLYYNLFGFSILHQIINNIVSNPKQPSSKKLCGPLDVKSKMATKKLL